MRLPKRETQVVLRVLGSVCKGEGQYVTVSKFNAQRGSKNPSNKPRNSNFKIEQNAKVQNPKSKGQSQKHYRAAALALALAIAAEKAGERVGLTDHTLPPARSKAQIFLMAERLATEVTEDYVKSTPSNFVKGSSAI